MRWLWRVLVYLVLVALATAAGYLVGSSGLL